MRVPLIAPADLTPEQHPFYEDMRSGIEQNFRGFKAVSENGGSWGRSTHGCTNRSSANRSGSSSKRSPMPLRCQSRYENWRFWSPQRSSAQPTSSTRMSSAPSKAGCRTTRSPPSSPASTGRSHSRGGDYLRCRLRAGRERRAARADLPPDGESVRTAQRGRTDLPCRVLLLYLRHVERL